MQFLKPMSNWNCFPKTKYNNGLKIFRGTLIISNFAKL